MNQLSFNWIIFNSFLVSIYWHILNHLIVSYLRNIFCLVLHCIVISHISFSRDLNSLSNFFVLHDSSLIRDILNSTFPFYWWLLSDDWLCHYRLGHNLLGNNLLWNILRWLSNEWRLLHKWLLVISRSLLEKRLGGNWWCREVLWLAIIWLLPHGRSHRSALWRGIALGQIILLWSCWSGFIWRRWSIAHLRYKFWNKF